jgi:hypothetical protein
MALRQRRVPETDAEKRGPSGLRCAGFSLTVDNIRITLCDDPARILLDRDGEGGEFSLREFAHVLHKFISERL